MSDSSNNSRSAVYAAYAFFMHTKDDKANLQFKVGCVLLYLIQCTLLHIAYPTLLHI